MRSDINKILCDGPRYSDSWSYQKKGRRQNLDEMPFSQSMSRGRYGNKQLGEYLSPLKRYIEKQIGRPWNKVFSEMMAELDTRDPIQRHILEHVDSYIAVKCSRCDVSESRTGLVSHASMIKGAYLNGYRFPVNPGSLFVDPNDGIIKRAKSLVPNKPKPVKEQALKVINRNQIAVKEEGIWYTIDLVEFKNVREWIWSANTDPEDRSQANVGNHAFGWYSNKRQIGNRLYPAYLYPSNGGRYGDYFDVGKYFSHANNWQRGDTMHRLVGRDNIVGHNKRQMQSKKLRQMNLRNDR